MKLQFLEMALDYAQNPASFLLFIIATIVTIILFGALTLSVVGFLLSQIVNIVSLYTKFYRENIQGYHPYTKSILENRCPELHRIHQIKKMGNNRAEIRAIVQSMINMLEANETEMIKYHIIQQLKSL